jgi:hypothetical protein
MDTAGPFTDFEVAPFALPKWPTPEQVTAWFDEHAGGHAYEFGGQCRTCGVHFLDATGRCAGPKPC